MTSIEIRRAEQHPRMRWANDAGWTVEIIAEPSAGRWEWRLSVADVETSGPFSIFPDVDRTIALLSGRGFALDVGTGTDEVITKPFHPFRFPGDVPTACRLLDGAVQDLNLMVDRTTATRRLDFVRIEPDTTVELVGVDIAVIVEGAIRVARRRLGYLDAVRPAARDQPLKFTAAGQPATIATVTLISATSSGPDPAADANSAPHPSVRSGDDQTLTASTDPSSPAGTVPRQP